MCRSCSTSQAQPLRPKKLGMFFAKTYGQYQWCLSCDTRINEIHSVCAKFFFSNSLKFLSSRVHFLMTSAELLNFGLNALFSPADVAFFAAGFSFSVGGLAVAVLSYNKTNPVASIRARVVCSAGMGLILSRFHFHPYAFGLGYAAVPLTIGTFVCAFRIGSGRSKDKPALTFGDIESFFWEFMWPLGVTFTVRHLIDH